MQDDFDLGEACAREPIHVPGSIQPHGALIVADQSTQEISHAAGDIEKLVGAANYIGASLGSVLGDKEAARIALVTNSNVTGGYVGRRERQGTPPLDISAHVSGTSIIVEIEPAMPFPTPAVTLLAQVEEADRAFERSKSLQVLCDRAAIEFRRLTGFDRVMVYRFLDDEAGVVVAESQVSEGSTFLNHHFPGSDIPAQARALYVRNRVRVIPDISYSPAPLFPAFADDAPLDMSDCHLRSVSPIHVQYLKNMGIAASASVSIAVEGSLWGLIACHNLSPKLMPHEIRTAARSLANSLARQIRSQEDADKYRDSLRLRAAAEDLAERFESLGGVEESLDNFVESVAGVLECDGAAVLFGNAVLLSGVTPDSADVKTLSEWLLSREDDSFASHSLSTELGSATGYRTAASGLLATIVSRELPFVIMWFRAEEVEVVNWAGNPHKAVLSGPGQTLAPRSSFEAWKEDVRGRSRRWKPAELEAGDRVRTVMIEQRARQDLRKLNTRLLDSLSKTDLLIKEVNHRVQNSLQLVSSFLALQSKTFTDPLQKSAFEEARNRLSAVALVHRRLYRADEIQTVDFGRYLDDLFTELRTTFGSEWAHHLYLDAASVLIPTDRVVSFGLVVTELVINANKYAYDGAPGPIHASLKSTGNTVELSIADRGLGMSSEPKGTGFGNRMLSTLIKQLGGTIEFQNNHPGLRVVITAPVSLTPATTA